MVTDKELVKKELYRNPSIYEVPGENNVED